MTEVITTMFPDGLASAPGLALASDPGRGIFKGSDGRLALALGDGSYHTLEAGVVTKAAVFQAAGAHVWTATLPLPAGSIIHDIGLIGVALWTAGTSASAIVGDDVDPDGFFTATDLKATDLLAGETNNIEHPGGKAGAYIASEQRLIYQATERNIVGVVTQVGTSNVGTTVMYVMYSTPQLFAPVQTS